MLAVGILCASAASCGGDASTKDSPARHPAYVRSASATARALASGAPSSPASADAAEAIATWKSGKPLPSSDAPRPFHPIGGAELLLGKKGAKASANLRATAMTDGKVVVVSLDGEVACKEKVAESAFSASFSFFGSSGAVRADGSLELEGHGIFGAGGSARPEALEGRAGVFAVSGDPGFRGHPGAGALITISLETSCGNLQDLARFVIAVPSEGPPHLRMPTPAELREQTQKQER